MAKVELFFGNQNINLTASVGKNGVNTKGDVMVIQAMLKAALEGRVGFRGVQFRQPTGTIDRETIKLIKEFQRFGTSQRVKITVDGRIDPAKGERPFGKRSFWTILSLNCLLMERWFLTGSPNNNHIEHLCRKYPQLFEVIHDVPVGTLNLSLESATRGIGSLNLGLE